MVKKNTIIHIGILTIIVLIAVIVRVYNIDIAPSGIYPDEANNGTNAYHALTNNDFQWFYPDNNGREGLYINLIALSFHFFGVSIFSLKLPSILLGTLTVIGVYFLSRELFISQPRIALIASYLTAVSFWAINFSRIAFRAILMLPILTFSFYFLFRGIRSQKIIHFVIAGFIFGLGFHSYIAFRIAPVLLFVLLLLFLIQNNRLFTRKFFIHICAFIVSAFVITAPMLYTFYAHPEFLSARTGDVSIFANDERSLPATIMETTSLSFFKFNFYGDQNWRHGYPPHPTLNYFAGALFLCGLITSIGLFFRFVHKRCKNKNRNRKLVIHGFLLAWFFAFLAPEFLTTEGLPHSLRSIGVLPVVYIFAAFCANFFIERAHKRSQKWFVTSMVIALFVLMWIGASNIFTYHVLWAHAPQQAAAFNKDLTDIGKYLHTLPTAPEKYIIAGPLARLPIQLLNTQTPHTTYLYHDQVDDIDLDQNFYILMPYYDQNVIDQISAKKDVFVNEIFTELDTSFVIIQPLNQSHDNEKL